MLGDQINWAGVAGDELRPGVGRRGHRLPWTVGRRQESVWIGLGCREGREKARGQKSHLNLILSHRRDAVVIKVVPLATVLVAGKCRVWKNGRAVLIHPLASKRCPPSSLSHSSHPDDLTTGSHPSHPLGISYTPHQGMPLPHTVSITQAPIMVGHRNEIIFVQLWG